jgi:hypothetical protein
MLQNTKIQIQNNNNNNNNNNNKQKQNKQTNKKHGIKKRAREILPKGVNASVSHQSRCSKDFHRITPHSVTNKK